MCTLYCIDKRGMCLCVNAKFGRYISFKNCNKITLFGPKYQFYDPKNSMLHFWYKLEWFYFSKNSKSTLAFHLSRHEKQFHAIFFLSLK